MSGRIGVFGYGSLADPASASRTLGRETMPVGGVALEGWTRGWTVMRDNRRCEKTFARDHGTEPFDWVLSLNVEPTSEREAPNGVLLIVEEEELPALAQREVRYDQVDVSSEVLATEPAAERTLSELDGVITYRAKEEHRAPVPPRGDCVILASYASAVERAFAGLGDVQAERYRQSTGQFPVEVTDAVLIKDEIPDGNPRDW